jgi:sugar/nucleoside kinase (ribokinase family)
MRIKRCEARNPNLWHSYEAVEDLVEQLLDRGPKQVLVKQGGEGAAFGERDEGIASLPPERLEAASTLGAGDTFNAGLIHGLCRGQTLEEVAKIGLRLATQAVKRGRGVLGALEWS